MKQTDIIREYLVKNPHLIWENKFQFIANKLGVANAAVRYAILKLRRGQKGYIKDKLSPIQEVFKEGYKKVGKEVAIDLSKDWAKYPDTHSPISQKTKDIQTLEEAIEELKIKWSQDNSSNSGNKPAPKKVYISPYLGGNPDNTIIIGDIHEPFSRSGYLEHCIETQKRYDCGTVVFIGDIADHHYSSFHDVDPDGLSAGDELSHTIDKIAAWYHTFPVASVCRGNHDNIIIRKAFSSGLSKKWVKGLEEVYQTPNWTYDLEFEINGVLYTHTLGNVHQAALHRRQSIVVGHEHTKAEIKFNVSSMDIIFSMNVGCGIDDKQYAFAYAKLGTKKSVISCGVVLDKGKVPVIVPMSL